MKQFPLVLSIGVIVGAIVYAVIELAHPLAVIAAVQQ